jgi:gliding motility-associated-like protein
LGKFYPTTIHTMLCEAPMKRFVLPTILLFSFLLSFSFLKASHMMGVDMTYECLNACTIRVHLRAYRDCTGASSISNNATFVAQTPGCSLPTAITAWSAQATQEVTPLCPGAATSCTVPGSAINGVEEFYWFRDYDICAVPNCIFTIQWSGCCRNPAITSLSSPGSQGIAINATTLNTNITPCNSSPQFVNPPVPYICAGQPFTFNQGAFDPEGDSLVYSIGPCNQTFASQVGYNGTFSATSPLGPSWAVAINSATGDITITPQPGNIQVGVMCVYVGEYRNGILINTIVRDIQMTVLNCPLNNLPTVSNPSSVSGGSANGLTVTTCVNSNLCFSLPTVDPNAGQIVTTWWSQNIPGATFSLLGNPGIQDTLVGTPGNPPTAVFCWTPTATGTYSFLMTTNDDACPIIGSNQFTITIIVGNLQGAANIASNGCGTVTLCADSLTGQSPFTFVWTGPGGLSGNPQALDSCVTHVYPASGTYDWFLQITDSNGCVGNDTGTVSVFVGVFPNAGPDISFCSGGSGGLGGLPTPNYSYSWSPTTGLSNPTASQTNVTLTNNSTLPQTHVYLQTATDQGTGCSSIDTVVVTVWPPIVPSTTSISANCFGQANGSATVNTVGGMSPFLYQWNAAAGSQTTQTAINLAAGPYSVTVIDSVGCSASATVTVTQPTQVSVIAGGFNTSCFGGSDGHLTSSASGGVGPYGYLWLPINQSGPVVVGLPAGPYLVTATDSRGCIDTASTVIGQPSQIALSMSNTPTSCALQLPNGSAGVQPTGGTPGYTYLWNDNNGQTTALATGLAAGNYTVTVTDANGCTMVGSTTVGAIPPPTVSTGPDGAFCEGEGGVGIQAFAASGTPGYWYTWTCQSGNCGLSNINSPNPNANPTASQYYYVQVTDTNGCLSNIDSVFVTVLPKPIVDAGPDVVMCGDSAPCVILTPTITGTSGPYTFQWYQSAGLNNSQIMNPCAHPDTTTAYTLVVTAGNGCSSDFTTTDTLSTVVVHVNPVPIADAGPDRDICLGDTTQLEGLGYGAGPVYTYEWSPFNGLSSNTIPNPFANPIITTTYTLVVWSNGCPSYGDEVVLNVHTNPTVSGGPDREMCLGDSVMLDGQAGGDSTATYTFFWTPNVDIVAQTSEDPMVAPIQTTTYYVQSTTSFGCKSPLDAVLVTLLPTPVANAGDNATICAGNEYQLDGSYTFTTTDPAPVNDIFFSWTPSGTLTDPTILDPFSQPTGSGYYHLTVYSGTCATEDSVFITVIPGLGLDAATDTSAICEGGSVHLTSTAVISGGVYTWTPSTGLSNPNSDSTFASPSQTTTYTLVGTLGGCTDTASVTVTIIPTPTMAYLNSGERGCAPYATSFMQTSADAVAYTWNFGDGSPVSNEPQPMHTYDTPGSYNVTLTGVGPGGCAASVNTMTITVTAPAQAEFHSNPAFPAQLSLPNTHVDFVNDSKDGVSYHWNFGDGITSSEVNPGHVYSSPGEFMVTLTVTNADGCQSKIVHGPYVILAPDLFIPNVFSPNGDGVNDAFMVNYSGSQPFAVTIFDRWGLQMYSSNNKVEGWDGKVANDADANDGVYYYRIQVGDRAYTGPLTLVR